MHVLQVPVCSATYFILARPEAAAHRPGSACDVRNAVPVLQHHGTVVARSGHLRGRSELCIQRGGNGMYHGGYAYRGLYLLRCQAMLADRMLMTFHAHTAAVDSGNSKRPELE